MIERKYSVDEIDQMRELVQKLHFMRYSRYPNGSYGGSGSHSPKEREEILRTYMIAGISLEELEERFKEKIKTFPLIEFNHDKR